MNNIITNYDDFSKLNQQNSMWYIIEYNPEYLGYENDKDMSYCSSPNRYSLLRTEILSNPTSFAARLEDGVYRIWTSTPYEYPW